MALYATNRFPGDGTTTSYEFNFVGKYIARTHVKVYQEDNATKARTYVSLNDSNFLNDTTLRSLPVTPVGSTLVIYRETPKPPLVDFVNGSRFTEYNMDLVARQGLFVAMEAMDAGGAEARQQMLDAITVVVGLSDDAAAAALAAATSASNSAGSATLAQDAKVAAEAANSAAQTARSAAQASATAASASASNAGTSAASASTSASTASTQAYLAGGYAVSANTQASNASSSALSASNSASAAAGSVSAVSASASAAAASAATAAARADEIARRNLGARASPPTTDDHGAPLLTGALYWDTSLPGMRSWNGSAWVTLPAATKASVGLDKVDNTSDANKPVSTATQTALNGKQAALGFTPVQQGGVAGQGPSKVYIGWANDNSGLLCRVGATNFDKTWPINVIGTASRAVNPQGSSAVEQAGDIGASFGNWGTTANPALQLNTPNSNSAYMVWRATRVGARHVAAMHVYEGNMTVTMSVGSLNRFTWDESGNFTATGNVIGLSDIRLKTDVTKIEGALEKVCAINGYTYTRKDTGARQTGVVAQEVQKVLPEAVMDNGENLAVAYGNMVGLLIEAIKELKSEVDQLKGK